MRVLLAGLLALVAVPALAEWAHTEQGGAFDDNPTHLAVGASGSYGFGLRCRQGGPLEAIYITPESVDDQTAEIMSAFPTSLLIRIDDDEPQEFTGSVEVPEGELGVVAEVPASLADDIEGASRRVAVAIKTVTGTFHEREFDVRGSTAAATALKEGCALASPG